MPPLQPTGDPATDLALLRAWLDAGTDQRLLIETSGSTGAPKRVLLTRDAVLASVEASARRVGTGRWVLRLPSSYIAGIQVLVRSLVAGQEPSLDGDMDEGDCLSLVPTQLHRALTDADETKRLAACHVVLLGGGPFDPELRERAEAAGINIVATYGASETAGGCVYDGYPLDGVAMVIGGDGRIQLGGATIFEGYDGDEELTRRHLIDGWFLTNDAGRLADDGRLQLLGRLDDVVVSGGVKIPLPAVSRRLREHPRVEHAECVGIEDAEWGTRVVAVVVGRLSLDQARDWVSEVHPRAWAPRSVTRVDAIPLLDNGKVDRRALEELAR